MKYICTKQVTKEMVALSVHRTTSISGTIAALKLTSTMDKFCRKRYMGRWRLWSRKMTVIMTAFPIRVIS
jgi:hypothetical protein